jgi:hypothetical protein
MMIGNEMIPLDIEMGYPDRDGLSNVDRWIE